MKIKFACACRRDEAPSFFFEGDITNFKSDIDTTDEKFALNLFNHLTKKNTYIITKCDIEE